MLIFGPRSAQMMLTPRMYGPVIPVRKYHVVWAHIEELAHARLAEIRHDWTQCQKLHGALDEAIRDGPGLKAILEVWQMLRDVAHVVPR